MSLGYASSIGQYKLIVVAFNQKIVKIFCQLRIVAQLHQQGPEVNICRVIVPSVIVSVIGTQIKVSIEVSLTTAGIVTAVLINNVCVNIRDHLGTAMARITLDRFYVAMTAYQFVTRAKVTETVECYPRQICLLLQLTESLADYRVLTRTSIIHCQHQIRQ